MKPTQKAAAVNSTYYAAGRHLNYKPSEYQQARAAVPGHVEEYLAKGGKIDVLPEPEYSPSRIMEATDARH